VNKIFRILILPYLLILRAPAAEFWVAPGGNESNPGTAAQPFASIATAQCRARELQRLAEVDTNEPVRIVPVNCSAVPGSAGGSPAGCGKLAGGTPALPGYQH
jgi:hypothetical protein